jgi:hypothetical protein
LLGRKQINKRLSFVQTLSEESILRLYGIAVIISAILIVIETNAMLFAPSFLFRFGLRIKTMRGIHIDLDSFEIGKEYKTAHVKFVRDSKNSCLFSRRFGFFSNPHVAIKGEILQSESGTMLIWRIPLGSILFFSLWLFGWIKPLSIFYLTASEIFTVDFVFSTVVTLLITFLVLFIYFYSLQQEQKRAQLVLSDILFLSLHNQ